MMDNHVGNIAWIPEKLNSQSGTVGNDLESVHSEETTLKNIMVYLVTGTFNTASWIYYDQHKKGDRVLTSNVKHVEVQKLVLCFPLST